MLDPDPNEMNAQPWFRGPFFGTVPDGDAELVPDLDGELEAPGPHSLEDLLQHILHSCARPYSAVHGMHCKNRVPVLHKKRAYIWAVLWIHI